MWQVAHELVALQMLTLLLEQPTDDSVEIACTFTVEAGATLAELTPSGPATRLEAPSLSPSLPSHHVLHSRTFLTWPSSSGRLNAIFERLRGILHEGAHRTPDDACQTPDERRQTLDAECQTPDLGPPAIAGSVATVTLVLPPTHEATRARRSGQCDLGRGGRI